VQRITDEWFMANHAWELEAEAYSNGHQAELDEFCQIKPRPRLKDFMVQLSQRGDT
jgi:hypothetical protein